jgi:chemotaxis protein CheX
VDVLIIGPEGSQRDERFARFLRGQGHSAHRATLPEAAPPPGVCLHAAVVFADGPPRDVLRPEAADRLRRLGVGIVEIRDPGWSDARVLEEVQARGAASGPAAVREALAEPLTEAVRATLQVMAGADAFVQRATPAPASGPPGDFAAVIGLRLAAGGLLALRFPAATAAALAGRVLAELGGPPDAEMARDCLGEVANVVAGQAKALLADTPHRFTFSTPRVLTGPEADLRPEPGAVGLALAFSSDVGEFALEFCWKEEG